MKKLAFIILLSVLIFGCGGRDWVSLTIDPDSQYISFSLRDANITQPFIFSSDTSANTGSVFYQTDSGKTWLQGEPSRTTKSVKKFSANWLLDDRDIKVTIQKEADRYTFSFTAEPDSGILKWGFNVSASKNEYFTRLFERVVDGPQQNSWQKGMSRALNLRGLQVDMIIKPTLSLYCPFYLSSNHYGLYIKGTWPGYYDFCKKNPDRV